MQRKHKLVIALAGAVLIAVVAFQWRYLVGEGNGSQQRSQVTSHKEIIRLFFPVGGVRLGTRVLEIRSDLPNKEKGDLILRELKKDKVISPGVQLRDVAIGPDGVLYLNLSRNLAEAYPSARPEIVVVYSLVNSFASSFRDVRKVQLLLDGEPAYTIGGLVYTYLPLEFNKELVED